MHRKTRDIEALYEEHARSVLNYARRRIDPDTAEEVLADVFVIALRKPQAIPADARTWLLGVARRVLANKRRYSVRQAALYTRLAEERRRSYDGESGPDSGAALLALASLGPRDREVLVLAGWDGLSPTEGGAVLGISASAFSTRLSRARERFAGALQPERSALASRKPQVVKETAQ